MKPERAKNNLLAQVMGPIVAPNMEQFVTGDRGLKSRVHGRETFGQKNYRRRKAKGDGRIYIARQAELGAGVHAGAHFFENGSAFSKPGNWRRCLPELPKSQKSHRQDRESYGHSRENYDAENLGDDLNAGKMPVGDGGAGCRDDLHARVA